MSDERDFADVDGTIQRVRLELYRENIDGALGATAPDHAHPPTSTSATARTSLTTRLMILAELVDGFTSGVERRFRRKEERSSSFRGPRPADPRRETVNLLRELHQVPAWAAPGAVTRAMAA